MARMRTLKPEAFSSETLTRISVYARWNFAGVWTYVDDDGRGKADPRLIKAAVWPLDDDVTPKDVACYLDEAEREHLICRYEMDGKQYLHVVNFREHQKPNRPVESKLPECPRSQHGGLSEDAVSPHGVVPPGVLTSVEEAAELDSDDNDGASAAADLNGGLSAGQTAFSEDAVSQQGAFNTTSFPNTPSPPPRYTTKGDVDGVGEGSSRKRTRPVADAPPRADVERLCKRLAEHMEHNGCLARDFKITQEWRDEARRLLDLDCVELAEAGRVLDWCQRDPFWLKNIHSMPKFRKQFSKLRQQAQEAGVLPSQPRMANQVTESAPAEFNQ